MILTLVLDAAPLGCSICMNPDAALRGAARSFAHQGRRRRERRDGDADGGGARTGPMRWRKLAIGEDMTAGELHGRSPARCRLMVAGARRAERGTLQLTPQPETGVSYAAKIARRTRIDW